MLGRLSTTHAKYDTEVYNLQDEWVLIDIIKDSFNVAMNARFLLRIETL